jgi:four helix bundle protein
VHVKAQALLDRLVAFGVQCSILARGLRNEVAGEHIARQLVRSATSAAANYAEACDAESRLDFVHKAKLCLKELRETSVWLRTIAGLRESARIDALIAENNELISILVASINTARSRNRPIINRQSPIG